MNLRLEGSGRENPAVSSWKAEALLIRFCRLFTAAAGSRLSISGRVSHSAIGSVVSRSLLSSVVLGEISEPPGSESVLVISSLRPLLLLRLDER